MLYIFDRKEKLLEILNEEDYSDFKHITKVNSSDSLSFSTSKKKNIKKNNKVGFFKDGKFQLFLIYDFNDTISLDENKIDIECISDFNLLGNFIIEDKRIVNGTLREAAQKALEGMDYQVGITEDFELRNINFYFISRLKALNDILDTFKAEFDIRIEIDEATGRITNKYIDFKHRLGEDTGLRFTFDTNLKSIEKSPVGDHFNVLYGRGKSLETDNGGFSRKLDFAEVNNGKKYVEDLDSISKYGRLEGIFSDDNISDKRELLNKTLDKLQEVKDPKFTYKVTLEYLNTLEGFEHYKCHKGDTIIIIDEEEDLILEARILEIEETEDITITLGSIQSGLVDSDFESEIGDIKDKVNQIENDKPDIDTLYPDILPNKPNLKAKGLFATVALEWTFSSKDYYTYELYASKIKGFNPTSDNIIFEGKASAFLHEVKANETWYYRCRCKNTYGRYTDFSSQVIAHTNKISDAAEYFDEASIGHAIIESLDLDKATVGKLKGKYIEAKELAVIDGNEKETLKIDSWGNVSLDVTELKIRSEDVATETETVSKIKKAISDYKEIVDNTFEEVDTAHNNLVETMEGSFKDGIINKTEAYAIKQNLIALETEITEINKTYLTIYSSNELLNEFKVVLEQKHIDYIAKYKELKTIIESSIADDLVTTEENTLINEKMLDYNKAYADIKNQFNISLDAIGKNRVDKFGNTVNDKFTEVEKEAGLIKETVTGVENTLVEIDGEVKKKATKKELTEFKQTSENFQMKVEKGFGGENKIKNSGFLNGYSHFYVTEYEWNGTNSSVSVWGDSSEWVMSGTNALVIKGTRGSHGAYGVRQDQIKLKPNTTYTLSGYAAVHRGTWRISLAQNDWGWIASSRGKSSGGKNPKNWDRFSITFTTGAAYDYLTNCKLDLMLENAENDAYVWFTSLVLNEGDFALPWSQRMGEIYNNILSVDENGIICNFENGTYAQMGREGFKYYDANTGFTHHAICYAVSFGIPAGNPGRTTVRLPIEFTKRQNSLRWTVALRGYYYSTSGKFFVSHLHCTGSSHYVGSDGCIYCNVEGVCRLQNADNYTDQQYRDLTAMLIAIC